MWSSHAGQGCPLRGVVIYVWCPARLGTRAPHWHPSETSRWRRASRVPSAVASYPTLSPLQLSSSRRSAAARLVGSMRSRGPGMLPSRDRSLSYVGPPSLKCATVSRLAPPSGGSHRMVAASRPHACISVARSTLAAWSTRRGGRGARMSNDLSPLHPTCGSGAACSQPLAAASHGWSGPAPRIMVGRGRVCGPQPSK